MRGRPELERLGRETLAHAEATYRRLRAHPRGARGGRRPRRAASSRCRPASTSTSSCCRSEARRSRTCSREARARPAEPGQRRGATARRGQRRRGSRRSSASDEPTVVYFGKLIEQKGVQVLLEAMQRRRRAARRRRLRARTARVLEAAAPPRTLFTGPLEHRHLVHLLPLADVTVVPSIFPEAFGMVAAEAAAAGSPPLVARHSGLAEVAAGLEEAYPERLRHLASFETGDAADLARKLERAPRALRRPTTKRSGRPRAPGRRRALVVGERRRSGCSQPVCRLARLRFRADGRGTTRLLAGAARAVRATRSRPAPTSPSPSRRSSRCSIRRRSS